MKKSRLIRASVAIIFGLNLSAMAGSTVTVGHRVVNAGQPDNTADISFQSFCLETNEHLSFAETYFVDVSDVTLSGNPSPVPLDLGTAYFLQKGFWNLNRYTSNNRVLNVYENPNLTEFKQDQNVRIAAVPASGAVPLTGFGTGLLRWLRKRKCFC